MNIQGSKRLHRKQVANIDATVNSVTMARQIHATRAWLLSGERRMKKNTMEHFVSHMLSR